jgi:hypothetical protein
MEATDAAKAGQGGEALKRCSDGAARDDIKQKETKGSPRLVRISSLFSLLSFVQNLGLTISRGSWRLSAFGATTRPAAKIIRENDE